LVEEESRTSRLSPRGIREMPRKDYEPKLTRSHIAKLLEEKNWSYAKALEFAEANNLLPRAVIAKITQLPELSYEKKPAYEKKPESESVGAIRSEIRDICNDGLSALDRMPKDQLMVLLKYLKGN
jgi:hypothetical protein